MSRLVMMSPLRAGVVGSPPPQAASQTSPMSASPRRTMATTQLARQPNSEKARASDPQRAAPSSSRSKRRNELRMVSRRKRLGKPQVEAPTPLAVVVERISGTDQLVNELAAPAIYRAQWQGEEDVEEDDAKDAIKAQIAAELADRIDEK